MTSTLPQPTRKTRTVRLENITFPVCVAHGNLAARERIDDRDSRIDTLRIGVDIGYDYAGPVKSKSMERVWNYGALYEFLCLSDVPTVTGPLETILDAALTVAKVSVGGQGLALQHAFMTADRLGLSVGYPQLCSGTQPAPPPALSGNLRSVGIKNHPLVAHVDHSWCTGDQRVEHIDLRTESLAVSFNAVTAAGDLSAKDLSGLFNYAGLIHTLNDMQGVQLNGPVEEICDTLTDMLQQEAHRLDVQLLQTSVFVRRTGYARCTPVLGLQAWYA